MARKSGLPAETPDFNINPSLTLGVSVVSPVRIAALYATFTSGGVYREPVMVSKVLDRSGKVVWQPDTTGTRAMSVKTAGEMADSLQNAVRTGTPSANPALRNIEARVAGIGAKTATSDFGHSAWFAGFGSRSTAVAMFRRLPDGVVGTLTAKSGAPITGSTYPTTVWARFADLTAG